MKNEYLMQAAIMIIVLSIFYVVFLRPVTNDIKEIAVLAKKINETNLI